jgi:hypothetical protein
MRYLATVGLLCALTACDGYQMGPSAGPQSGGPPEGERRQEFVVFSQASLTIDRLETPIQVPVSAGSRASPETLESSDPAVVSVDPSGALVGHANGSATIRAPATSQALLVTIRAVQSIKAVPARLQLRPLEAAQVRVVDSVGSEVPADSVRWSVSAADIAQVNRGTVYAGEEPGSSTMTAMFGTATATVQVQVGGQELPEFSVSPAKPKYRVGAVMTFQALARSGPVAVASWTSSNSRILRWLQDGVFTAVAQGEALVCAQAGQRNACTKVGVQP